MGLLQNITNAFRGKENDENVVPEPVFKNSLGIGGDMGNWLELGKSKKLLVDRTSETMIEDKHLYRGLGFGIIQSITNAGIVTAEENVRTTCSSTQREVLAEKDEQIEHPYITLWRNSPYFSEYDFWKSYLTYIQLKGEFFIYVNRKPLASAKRYKEGTVNKMSNIAYMKLINPFEMKAHEYDDLGNVTVWRRTIKNPHNKGKNHVQDIPAHQIIHVIEHNPWENYNPYSLLDASRDNLFTLENAKDFTRHALVGNVNAPGLLAVDGEFQSDEEFKNYVNMLKKHESGELIVAAGNAKATYQSMNQNLDGASQEKIRGLERDEMIVASGLSKSILGIETTGLTRDVAATQKLTFVEKTVIPRIKLMLETLNYDYRTNYAGDFLINKYILRVTTPSVGDKAQELKELEIREEEYNMVQRYVDRGYTKKSAAQYVRGEIDVEQLQLEKGKSEAKMSPTESVELVDATERWAALIRAGNDPESVIKLIEGKISLAEFIAINKDTLSTPVDEEPQSDTSSDDEDEDPKKPTDYYDPDPDDYSTPRDEKETPADKKKKKTEQERKHETAIGTIMRYNNVTYKEAEEMLRDNKIDKKTRCRIQDNIEKFVYGKMKKNNSKNKNGE